MSEFSEEQLRQIIRSEIESVVISSPPWLIERMTHELSTAIAKRLNERTVQDVTNAIVDALGNKLTEAVLCKVAATVDRAFVRAMTGTFSTEFVSVYRELERLRKAVKEIEHDDWWRRGQGQDSDEDESP